MKAWREVVELRDDVRLGELSLSEFAADLGKVMAGEGDAMYRDVEQFFRITFATDSLKSLAREVVLCLAGKSEKSVRQMSMTFGGGKTHALITLYHLVHDPASLPKAIPAVQEFESAIGVEIPMARVAAVLGDKIDVDKGFEAISPSGERRWLRQPWSIIAWQLGGSDGLAVLQDDLTIERTEPPAQNLWEKLLRTVDAPVLILMDEVLMYARRKVAGDGAWFSRLQDFFQYLTQAVDATPKCALMASILSTDPNDYDEVGSQTQTEISTIIGRVAGDVEALPVEEKDVPEVIRRRLFKLESVPNEAARKGHIQPIVDRMAQWDESVNRNRQAVESKFIKAFPFHPDLIDALYTKWTQLDAFQRTRGVLQSFAKALRDAHGWDKSPVIGPAVFLNAPGSDQASESIRRLSDIANQQEGKKADWAPIVMKELEFARDAQKGFGSLKDRELESAVMTTFIHSQPVGQKAELRELLHFAASTTSDRISFENGLRAWADRSWFLDDDLIETPRPGEEQPLPKEWRLGPEPNIRQMAAQARQSILATKRRDVDQAAIDAIRSTSALTQGAANYGAKVHNLPEQPHSNANFPRDDEEFHYVILRPEAACEANAPSEIALRMFEQDTSVDDRRVHKNLLVLLAPTPLGVEGIRDRVVDRMAWEHVAADISDQLKKVGKGDGDVLLQDKLKRANDARQRAEQQIMPSVRAAYTIGLAVDENGNVQAYGFQPGGMNTFDSLVKDDRFRIKTDALNPDAILPSGPYRIWHEDDPSRRIKDLVGAFAQNHRLPKIINVDSVYETIQLGCEKGLLVIRETRPDKSVATYWRRRPDRKVLESDNTEAWLPDHAELKDLPAMFIQRGTLPELWEGEALPYDRLSRYFSGAHVIQVVVDEGYSEPLGIPKVNAETLIGTVRSAVEQKFAWLTNGDVSLLGEAIADGDWGPGAALHVPPRPLTLVDILPTKLPAAWNGEFSSIGLVVESSKTDDGVPLPWAVIRPAVVSAVASKLVQLDGASAVPDSLTVASGIGLMLVGEEVPGGRRAEAVLAAHEIQELADRISELEKLRIEAGVKMTYRMSIDLEGDDVTELVSKLNEILASVSDDFQL